MATNLFSYLLESSICLAAFYVFFRVMLRQEPLLQTNRYFILLSVLLSLSIPAIHIPLQEKMVFVAPVFLLQEIPITDQSGAEPFLVAQYAMYAYSLVCIYMLLRTSLQIGKLIYFSRTSRRSKTKAYHLILTEGKLPTFSFFRLLFWDNSQPLSEEQKLQILNHELTHIRQWHSLDIIFLELVKVFFWFHPAVYLFKKALQQTHEYLADAAVVKSHNQDSYIQLLISQVFKTSDLTLTNPFSQFKTKNRIMMLHKLTQAKPAFWKLALSLPLIALLVLVYSCDTTNPEGLIAAKSSSQIKEVVEEMPAPVNNLQLDIVQRIKYPEKARKNKVEGKVFVQFVVKKDGSVDNIIVLKGIGAGCDEEAVRAVQEIRWHPGKEQGKAVDVRMVLPVTFALSDEKRAELMKNSDERMLSLEQHTTNIYELQTPSADNQTIYRVVDEQPEPKGGIPELMRYMGENIRYPEEARKKGIEGKVFVQFVVNQDGSIGNVQVLKGIGHGCDEEAARVVKAMPAWKPGVQKGEPVNVQMTIPIAFSLD